jgi:hypothetical protein
LVFVAGGKLGRLLRERQLEKVDEVPQLDQVSADQAWISRAAGAGDEALDARAKRDYVAGCR